jgi:hypothetical protein
MTRRDLIQLYCNRYCIQCPQKSISPMVAPALSHSTQQRLHVVRPRDPLSFALKTIYCAQHLCRRCSKVPEPLGMAVLGLGRALRPQASVVAQDLQSDIVFTRRIEQVANKSCLTSPRSNVTVLCCTTKIRTTSVAETSPLRSP